MTNACGCFFKIRTTQSIHLLLLLVGNVVPTNSVVQEEFNLAARKVSFAPMNRSLNMQSRSLSWRNGSIPVFRDNVMLIDGEFDQRQSHQSRFYLNISRFL